jgi:capsid protein
VDEVALELSLAASGADRLPTRPEEVQYLWIWPARPHVDPVKEANGEQIELANGTLTYSDALARKGKDLDSTIEQRAREKEMLEEAGLPPLPTVGAKIVPGGPAGQDNEDSEEKEADDDQD